MSLSLSLGRWLPVLRRIPGNMRQVALSIDDGPAPGSTEVMLALLERYRAKATFFVSGVRAVSRPDLVAAMVGGGHAVYGHGWEHIRLDRAGPERLRADMEKVESLLQKFRPTPSPYLVRLPYNGGYRNPHVHQTLRAWSPGCAIAHWSLSTEDHNLPPRCATLADIKIECSATVERILDHPHLTGAIILLHDQPFDVPGDLKAEIVATLFEGLLIGLTQGGYDMIPIQAPPSQPLLSRFVLL